ncbi:MAG: GNAT family N-acetyltransferase [Oscillospiraceae bacterium]
MRHAGTKELETERLRLRRFTVQDAPAMYANWANDAEVTRWMRWEPHQSAAETQDILRQWQASYDQPDYYHWAIVRKADGVLMGSIGILPGQEADDAGLFSPGYCIGRAFWGQGYTTEALQAVMDYFLHETDIEHLVCCHAAQNPASGRVMEKAGFVFHHDGVYHKQDGTAVAARHYHFNKQETE